MEKQMRTVVVIEHHKKQERKRLSANRKIAKMTTRNIKTFNNESTNEPVRIIVGYTGDQKGKDIRDEDVVRVSNGKWIAQHSTETGSWKEKSLLGTKNEGLILHPDPSKSFEVHVDCEIAGNWVKEDAMNDPSTAKSRTGYVISYQGCPITWASKLQTEVVLSTTESEYVGLSESFCIAIILMNLLKEMKEHGVELPTTKPSV
jgi:hypothetical protein